MLDHRGYGDADSCHDAFLYQFRKQLAHPAHDKLHRLAPTIEPIAGHDVAAGRLAHGDRATAISNRSVILNESAHSLIGRGRLRLHWARPASIAGAPLMSRTAGYSPNETGRVAPACWVSRCLRRPIGPAADGAKNKAIPRASQPERRQCASGASGARAEPYRFMRQPTCRGDIHRGRLTSVS